MGPIETFEYLHNDIKYRAKLYYDDCLDMDNLLGDTPIELIQLKEGHYTLSSTPLKKSDLWRAIRDMAEEACTSSALLNLMRTRLKGWLWLPVYAYVHGNVSLSTGKFSDTWDSAMSGFVGISVAEALKTWGLKTRGWKRLTKKRRERIYKALESHVEGVSKILNGEVYGYTIEEILPDTRYEADCTVDSLWGVVGMKYALENLAENLAVACGEYENPVVLAEIKKLVGAK